MSSTPPKRGAKTPNRMNRAQIRAMEVRAAETIVHGDEELPLVNVNPKSVGGSASARPRSGTRPVVLSRAQEYGFIRADLHRLLITAGALLAVMIVILFLVER